VLLAANCRRPPALQADIVQKQPIVCQRGHS
jgi:hypothetical protein